MMVKAGVAAVALEGQAASGDRGVFLTFPGGAVIAAIDGLGHGEHASTAAAAAVDALSEDPAQPVDELVRRCHTKLRNTRGAVMTLASFVRGAMTWVGVGNVDGILVRTTGVEGVDDARGHRRLPAAAADAAPVRRRAGRHARARHRRHPPRLSQPGHRREPQTIADAILAGFSKATDDACVVVARYLGDAA